MISKLRNALDDDLVKKIVYDKLVIKVNAINTKIPSTTGLATKTQKKKIEKKIDDVDKQIPNISGLANKIDYNTNITEVENKVPSVIGAVTTFSLNTKVTENGNKMPNSTNLAEKAGLMQGLQRLEIPDVTNF